MTKQQESSEFEIASSLGSIGMDDHDDNAHGELSGDEEEGSLAAVEDDDAPPPMAEIALRQDLQERVLRRSLNNDEELMLKIVQQRLSLACDDQQQQQQLHEDQSAVAACVAVGVPGESSGLLRTSVGSRNATENDNVKPGERPVSYYETAFARGNSKVGAIAVGGPDSSDCGSGSSANSACSPTEFETSADLTAAASQMQQQEEEQQQQQQEEDQQPSGSYEYPAQEPLEQDRQAASLAVAAEVAPEMIDLEKSITERVRLELEESFRNTSLSGTLLENAPVAEIVGMMNHNSNKQRDQQQRDRRQRRVLLAAAAACFAVVLGVAITLVVVLGSSDSGYDFPPDHAAIADVPETICYERIPMLGRSEICPPQPQGSGVTNLVAESRLWNVPDAEVSILNAGEVRIDMEQGNFTMGQARELLPFEFNELVLINIKGAKLQTALERGLQKIFDDKAAEEGLNSTTPSGAFPYGAGIRWNVNMSESFPRRLYDIEINPRLEGRWEPLDLHRSYTVVTNDYLAGGGDAYHEFSSAEDEHVIGTGLNSLESFVEYCQHFGVLLDPPKDHYSTQTYIHNSILF